MYVRSSIGTGHDEMDNGEKLDEAAQAANETYREYRERRRPLHRARADKALADAEAMVEAAEKHGLPPRELLDARNDLERLSDCMADAPMPSISAEALETDEWLDYDDLRFQYAVGGNTAMLLEAFVILVDQGISPGQWILDRLADAFAKILEDKDPTLVARHMGLQGVGQGARSPLKEYDRQLDRALINVNMRTLIEEYEVSLRDAANAVRLKYELDEEPKTLVNRYESRAAYSSQVREFLDKHNEVLSGTQLWLSEDAEDEFLESFPASADKYLKKVGPGRT